MARSLQLFFLAFQILSITSFLHPNAQVVNGSKTGLTIKLIHRDSPDSPLYQPNLTEAERTRNLILQSKARLIYLTEQGRNKSRANALRPIVERYYSPLFLAQVGIGTFRTSPPLHYFLFMDTGSSLTWIQCQECRYPGKRCFYQTAPLFPSSQSTSYHNLIYNQSPLCFPNLFSGNSCTYSIQYLDQGSSEGFLAYESFTFDSTTAQYGTETIPGMVFGCGTNQQKIQFGTQGKIAGLLGLGWGPRALVGQLGARAGSRFSYCLQSWIPNLGVTTTLRFGSDIPTPPGLRTMPMAQHPRRQHGYFVNLIDISVADRRLGFPAAYFAVRPAYDSLSGTAFDSGTTYAVMVTPVYEQLQRTVLSYVSARIPGLRRVPGNFKICYEGAAARGPYDGLPSLTFHFAGDVDMVVQPQNAFYAGGTPARPYFCLAAIQSNYDPVKGGITLLGAMQQTDYRLIYDLGRMQFQFAPQDCSRSG